MTKYPNMHTRFWAELNKYAAFNKATTKPYFNNRTNKKPGTWPGNNSLCYIAAGWWWNVSALFYELVYLVHDNLRVQVMHHRSESYGFHVDSRTCEAPAPEMLLNNVFGLGIIFNHVANDAVLVHLDRRPHETTSLNCDRGHTFNQTFCVDLLSKNNVNRPSACSSNKQIIHQQASFTMIYVSLCW